MEHVGYNIGSGYMTGQGQMNGRLPEVSSILPRRFFAGKHHSVRRAVDWVRQRLHRVPWELDPVSARVDCVPSHYDQLGTGVDPVLSQHDRVSTGVDSVASQLDQLSARLDSVTSQLDQGSARVDYVLKKLSPLNRLKTCIAGQNAPLWHKKSLKWRSEGDFMEFPSRWSVGGVTTTKTYDNGN